MKTKRTAFAAICLMMAFLPALSAQVKGGKGEVRQEQNLTIPPDVVAMPDGGFLSTIDGTWDCGEFGTVVFTQKGDKVTGTYGEDGKILGVLKNNRFTGTWSEAGGTAKGAFDFTTSIESKTNRPTNLRGKWKNAGERKWQPAPWECVN